MPLIVRTAIITLQSIWLKSCTIRVVIDGVILSDLASLLDHGKVFRDGAHSHVATTGNVLMSGSLDHYMVVSTGTRALHLLDALSMIGGRCDSTLS